MNDTSAGPGTSGEPQLVGAEVLDAAAATIGVVDALLIDPVTQRGRWLRVVLSGDGARMVPVESASVDAHGRVLLPFDAQTLHCAPAVSGAVVSDADADALMSHYGFQ